jgi:hypothetical protein
MYPDGLRPGAVWVLGHSAILATTHGAISRSLLNLSPSSWSSCSYAAPPPGTFVKGGSPTIILQIFNRPDSRFPRFYLHSHDKDITPQIASRVTAQERRHLLTASRSAYAPYNPAFDIQFNTYQKKSPDRYSVSLTEFPSPSVIRFLIPALLVSLTFLLTTCRCNCGW